MNYLGHLALAKDNDEARIGHYLGDFVKGNETSIRKKYAPAVANGIIAHRAIDVFTDAHPAVCQAVSFLKPEAGRFAPIIVDVVFDYYLIKHWKKFRKDDFEEFVSKCYASLEIIVAGEVYPERCRNFTRRLIDHDVFHVYGNIDGIHRALCGIERRLKRDSPLSQAHHHIRLNYHELEKEFLTFFPAATQFGRDIQLDYHSGNH